MKLPIGGAGGFGTRRKKCPLSRRNRRVSIRVKARRSWRLPDHANSPFDSVAHHEVQHRVEEELRKVPEPYRTTLILRDLEEMSYEEIAEVLEISLGP